jgi:hypothetical protein
VAMSCSITTATPLRRCACLRATRKQASNQKGLLGLIFNKSQNNFDSRRFMAALTLRALKGVNLQWRLSGPGQAAAADCGSHRKRSFSAG